MLVYLLLWSLIASYFLSIQERLHVEFTVDTFFKEEGRNPADQMTYLNAGGGCPLPAGTAPACSALLAFILHCYAHTFSCSAFLVEILHSTA